MGAICEAKKYFKKLKFQMNIFIMAHSNFILLQDIRIKPGEKENRVDRHSCTQRWSINLALNSGIHFSQGLDVLFRCERIKP
jgi:hypothetical protein